MINPLLILCYNTVGDMMKRLILNFGGRKEGNCQIITNTIFKLFKNDEIKILNFTELNIHPCNRCNYECFKSNDYCPYYHDDVKKIYNLIFEYDFIYYIVPNYCDYPCANFFIFNERSNCIFQNNEVLLDIYLSKRKKFIVISNSNEENFRKAFVYHTTIVLMFYL